MGELLRLLVLTIAVWLIISSVRRIFLLPSFLQRDKGEDQEQKEMLLVQALQSGRLVLESDGVRTSFLGQGFHFCRQESRSLYDHPQAKVGRQEGTVVAFWGRTFSMTLWQAKILVVIVVGFTVLLIGVVMLVLPGPAVVVVPLGLAILATEFVWARRLLNHLRQTAGRVGSVFSGKSKDSQQ